MFEVRIQDQRINAYRVIKGHTAYDVEAKAAAQIAIWNEKAIRKQDKAESESRREAANLGHWEGNQQASLLTQEASASIKELENLLVCLISEEMPSWKDFRDGSKFSETSPKLPVPTPVPSAPTSNHFRPTLTFLDKLMPSRRESKERIATGQLQTAVELWQEAKGKVERANLDSENQFREEVN